MFQGKEIAHNNTSWRTWTEVPLCLSVRNCCSLGFSFFLPWYFFHLTFLLSCFADDAYISRYDLQVLCVCGRFRTPQEHSRSLGSFTSLGHVLVEGKFMSSGGSSLLQTYTHVYRLLYVWVCGKFDFKLVSIIFWRTFVLVRGLLYFYFSNFRANFRIMVWKS